jgi:hypothetical protein
VSEKTITFFVALIFVIAISTCTTGCKSAPVIIDSGVVSEVKRDEQELIKRLDSGASEVARASDFAEQLDKLFIERNARISDYASRAGLISDELERCLWLFDRYVEDNQRTENDYRELRKKWEAQRQVAVDPGDI